MSGRCGPGWRSAAPGPISTWWRRARRWTTTRRPHRRGSGPGPRRGAPGGWRRVGRCRIIRQSGCARYGSGWQRGRPQSPPLPLTAEPDHSPAPAPAPARAAGDADRYRELLWEVFAEWIRQCPQAVSPRARSDLDFRDRMAGYLAECSVRKDFDPGLALLDRQMNAVIASLERRPTAAGPWLVSDD